MRVWPDSLKGLKSPPVVEIALAVQFAQLPSLTMAHIGLFWKNFLDPSWTDVQPALPIGDAFETFEAVWAPPQLQFQFSSMDVPDIRTLIYNRGEDRIVQIQNSKFVYNWRKSSTEYPSFDQICGEFSQLLEKFKSFLRENSLGEMLPNQWELTYVDRIPQGSLWKTASDLCLVFPGLYPPKSDLDGLLLETQVVERRYEIEPKRGRVYLWGSCDTMAPGGGSMSLKSLARGGVTTGSDGGDPVLAGLRLGHEAIGKSFLAVVSDEALTSWKEQ